MRPVRSLSMLLVALAAVSGCGGDDDEVKAGAPATATSTTPLPVDINRAGSVAQLADCAYWKRASREERVATIVDIRGQHTPQRSETAESPLSDERAYEVFDRACAANPAGALRLYKLYVRVQAFATLSG